MINLDTHMLLAALEGSITAEENHVLLREPWGIAAIVLWEIAKLNQLERISLDLEDPEVAGRIDAVHLWPLDARVALASTRLDFRSDPADELIAATSIVHRVPLLTRDRVILASRLVPLAIP